MNRYTILGQRADFRTERANFRPETGDFRPRSKDTFSTPETGFQASIRGIEALNLGGEETNIWDVTVDPCFQKGIGPQGPPPKNRQNYELAGNTITLSSQDIYPRYGKITTSTFGDFS